jgi:FKBP-type peptidyl-prolyl cis-trans isomerase 2
MQKGDFVRIDYVGRVKDTREVFDLTIEDVAKKEKVFDPNMKYKAVPVIIGESFVIRGLDDELLKMGVGEKKNISLEPKEAFGERDPKMIKIIPKSAFRQQKFEPAPGMFINMSGFRGRIQSCDSGRVRVDFNNPLAGKALEYEVEIKEKITEPVSQIKAIFEFLGLSDISVKLSSETAEVEVSKALPPQIKEQISGLITKYVSNGSQKIEKVKFSEVYEKPAEKPEAEKAEEAVL